MDNRPIGFLDSGVGGLTVVRELMRQLPHEEIVYIGDSARAPYGPRPAEQIREYTWQLVNFLLTKDVKMIVIACNTATAVVWEEIKAQLDIPVLGVILPGASAAIKSSQGGKIGVIGTPMTVQSDIYRQRIHDLDPDLQVESLACPKFAPLVESGALSTSVTKKVVYETLRPLVGKVDSLILGCTHYPLLRPIIQNVMGPKVQLIDSGAECVRDISVLLNYFEINRSRDAGPLQHRFYTTANSQSFAQIGAEWLEKENIMTNKIYEYKDDQDWYVGVWDVYGGIYSLIKDPLELDFMDLARIFRDEEKGFPITITVMRWSSNFRLLSFIVEILNAEAGRNLEVIQRQGALLLVENGQLLHVELPKEGVDVEAFFETSKVRETLLIATRNEGKTKEFRAIFDKLGYDVENLNDYPDLPEVAETGMTFEENARLKAETISKLTGKMVLADDSGLKVDVLGGLPGVWSARFAGVGATDRENNAKLLHELAMVFDLKDRSAQFHTTLVVASPNKESLVVEADWPGYINFEPKGENGFGYDPLFLVGETGKSSAELTLEEKNSQSHRALAVKKLLEVFPSWQSKPSL